jgi:hypothetical protein
MLSGGEGATPPAFSPACSVLSITAKKAIVQEVTLSYNAYISPAFDRNPPHQRRHCVMHHPSFPALWQQLAIADRHFQVLNLDHPHVAAQVMGDIETGIQVYYDRRWQVTTRFCHFLLAEPAWTADRTVLVLGAGIGLETLVIGSLCRSLYINDLSTRALAMCARQLRQNRLTHFVCLPGRYEQLSLPAVDLIVGCFLIYNRATSVAMQQLLARPTPPVLLMNDNMPAFRQFLRKTSRPHQSLLSSDDAPCLLFAANGWKHSSVRASKRI